MSCKKLKPTNSADGSAMEAELSALGATNPSLWTSLFDVSQAIYGAKPMPNLSEWKPVYSTVQDLYRMSLKDPREFAVAQTLMTIAHQQRMKDEIIGQLSKTEPMSASESASPSAASTSSLSSVSQQLHEIRKEIDLLSSRVNDQLKSYGALKQRVDGVQQSTAPIRSPVVMTRTVQQESVPTILFVRTDKKEWEECLIHNFSSLYPEPAKLLDLYDCPKSVDKVSLYAKAKEYADPGVPPAVVFILSVMAKGNFEKMKITKTMGLEAIATYCNGTYYNLIPINPCVELVMQHSLRQSRLYNVQESTLQ